MNTQQKAIIGAIVIVGFIFFQRESRQKLTSVDIQPIIDRTEKAFSEAESNIFVVIPDDEPAGPDPDPEKCICKGTGEILQGDGHISPCPYHSKTLEQPEHNEEDREQTKVYVPQRKGIFFRR